MSPIPAGMSWLANTHDISFMSKIILSVFMNENVKNAHFAFLRKVNSDVKFVSQNECLGDKQLAEPAMYKW